MHQYPESLKTKILRLPYLISMGMEGVCKSGLAGNASKRHAMMESFVEGRRSYPGNQVIRSIIKEVDNDHEHLLEIAHQHDEILDCLDDQGVEDYDRLKEHMFRELSEVIAALVSHEPPQTVREYKDWLLLIAEKVALASKEGDFFGIGGERFSKKERELFKALKNHLYPESN